MTRIGGTETTWVVVDCDPSHGIARYARWVPGVQAGLVEVHCAPLAPGRSAVRVRYSLTPLAAAAVETVSTFLAPPRFAAFIEGWKRSIVAAGLAVG